MFTTAFPEPTSKVDAATEIRTRYCESQRHLHVLTHVRQGTLLVSFQNSASGQPLDDNELRRKFQQFGDVKAIKAAGGIKFVHLISRILPFLRILQ